MASVVLDTSDNTSSGMEAKEALKKIFKINVKRTHEYLGYLSEDTTRMMAMYLGMIFLRGLLPVCKSCAIAKAKQRNIPMETSGENKASEFNSQVFHNLAKIKVPEELREIDISKSNWHILVDNKLMGFKQSTFFETKGGIIQNMCKYMHSEKERSHPIGILHQDNAIENVALIKIAKGKDWMLAFEVKLMARKTPQQNSKDKTMFTVITAQARSMLIAAQVPDLQRFKLLTEVVMTATFLNNLVPVILNGESKARWEHAGHKLPVWVKNLQTFGEAGTVKEEKKGKVLDRGVTMMFVGYYNYHRGNRYKMCNPVTNRVVITCDAIWLRRMYFTRQVSQYLDRKMPVVSVPINMNKRKVEDNLESLKVVMLTTAPTTEEREGTTNVSLEKSSNWVTTKTRFGHKVGRKSGTYNPTTGTIVKWINRVTAVNIDNPEHYYNVMGVNKDEEKVLEDSHNELFEFVNVGAGIGRGFLNTQELRVMKYHEAINGSDGKLWKTEVVKEYQRMIDSGVFEPVKLSKVPKGVKLIDTT